MALFDLLGRRWAMGVLWTSCEIGPATFRDLQAACESISTAVLNQRLKELQAAGLLTRTLDGYAATLLGRRVYGDLRPLGATARAWASALAEMDEDVAGPAEAAAVGPRSEARGGDE